MFVSVPSERGLPARGRLLSESHSRNGRVNDESKELEMPTTCTLRLNNTLIFQIKVYNFVFCPVVRSHDKSPKSGSDS